LAIRERSGGRLKKEKKVEKEWRKETEGMGEWQKDETRKQESCIFFPHFFHVSWGISWRSEKDKRREEKHSSTTHHFNASTPFGRLSRSHLLAAAQTHGKDKVKERESCPQSQHQK